MSQAQEDDAILVAACRRGDPSAQTELVRRFKTVVFKRMFRYTGARELAEDLAQETMIRVLTRLDGFRDNVTLAGWVHRIAMNLMNDHFRAEKIHREDSLDANPLGAGGMIDAGQVMADDALIGAEERRLLSEAVAALPPIYREVMLLAHYDDRSVEEIARILDLGQSAVKMRLARGRSLLSAAMEANYARKT